MLLKYTHTHTHTHTYIYIYIYIYINLLANSIYGDREKEKNSPEFGYNNISRITVREKRKKVIGRKKRKGQICHTN